MQKNQYNQISYYQNQNNQLPTGNNQQGSNNNLQHMLTIQDGAMMFGMNPQDQNGFSQTDQNGNGFLFNPPNNNYNQNMNTAVFNMASEISKMQKKLQKMENGEWEDDDEEPPTKKCNVENDVISSEEVENGNGVA